MKNKLISFKNFILSHKIVITIISLFVIGGFLVSAPADFQKHTIIRVKEGSSIKEVAHQLKDNNIIRSTIVFNALVVLSREHVVEGSYLFEKPTTIFETSRRLIVGDYQIPVLQITFTEGMTSVDIAERLVQWFPNFEKDKFIKLAKEKEGYLFPDTYNLKEDVTPEELIKVMTDNFDAKINSVIDEIAKSKYSLEQIIIMASIVEKEATADSRDDVANILWKRFEKDMPLQVDAPFVYSVGRGSFDITMDDLRGDDPYNTYNKTGLTPTPISNPGLDSILASAKPQETPYLFFLTGRDGNMYYARNFDQHKQNRALYLD